MSKQLEHAGLVIFENEVKKNYHWNFTVNLLGWVFFFMGMSFASLNTVLPAFARRPTSSNLIIGLVPCLYTLGWFLLQILIANFTQRLKRNKGLLLSAGVGTRIPWFLLFLAVMLISSSYSLLLIVFFIIYAIFCFSGGIQNIAWKDMVAKVIPLRKRGSFFGWGHFLAGGMSIFAASLSIYLPGS